jgi:chromosome segregation ATPase
LLPGYGGGPVSGAEVHSTALVPFSYAAWQGENLMAARGNGRVPSWFPRAVAALKDVLLPELKEHTGLLRQHGDLLMQIAGVLREHSTVLHEHSSSLQEHTVLLREHSGILQEHSTILRQHSSTLQEHSTLLREHSAMMQEQAGILREHSGILREHTTSLQEHSTLLREQGERMSRLEGRVDGLERTTEQGFRTLSDHMAGLERSIDRLGAEVRVSLELRDRVARIEEKIGMTR